MLAGRGGAGKATPVTRRCDTPVMPKNDRKARVPTDAYLTSGRRRPVMLEQPNVCNSSCSGENVVMRSCRLATWRTIERYAANPLLPLNIPRLCRETGVSPRTLNDVCRANTGRSPIAYIKHCHMAVAHVMLRRASPEATVTNIATFCGFNNLGRFSVVYGRRYGQSPSQTLRQSPVRLASTTIHDFTCSQP
jgi:AraC-like DNA-binding protein